MQFYANVKYNMPFFLQLTDLIIIKLWNSNILFFIDNKTFILC